MPQALGALALALFQAGGPLWLSNALVGVGALGGVVGAVGQLALSFGVSAITGLIFRPKQSATKPDDVQVSMRVAVSDRVVAYGQMQLSGNWIFGESKDGDLHKVLVVCQGKLVTLLKRKIDDNVVTVDETNKVTSSPYDGDAYFHYRQGLPTETVYSELTAVFPQWDAAHRGDGVVTIYAVQKSLESDEVSNVFPSFKDTLFRIEGRFTEIWNPVTSVTEWSDNAAGIIRHFMVSRYGMRIPAAVISTPLALAVWQTSWNRAAESISLKAGGTEPRYRLWGAYKLSETPGSVLEAMLANCDGRPIMTRDGGVAVEIGAAVAPTVTLDKTIITACTSVTRGIDVRNTANKFTAKYLSAADDYQLVDADPWVNEASILARGELADDTTLGWSPSHSQARRLLKQRAERLSPEWQMTVKCRLGALAAFQERFVNVDYTIGETHIQGVFEVLKFTWNIGDKGILNSVTLQLQSIDLDRAYSWNPLTDEGTAPVVPDLPVDRDIPNVAGFSVVIGTRTFSGSPVSYALISFTAPTSNALTVSIQGKKTSDSTWSDVNVPEGETSFDGPLLEDGETYEFRARFISLKGRQGNWVTVTAYAFEIESLALFTAMTTKPNNTRKGHINTLIRELKTGGVWSRLNAIYGLAGHNQQASSLNWKAPTGAALTNSGCTFTTDRGFTGDGVSAHLDTGIAWDTIALQDDGSMWGWSLTEASANAPIVGTVTSSGTAFVGPRNGTAFSVRAHGAQVTVDNVGSSVGFFGWARNLAASFRAYRNKVETTVTQTSAAPPVGNMVILRTSGSYGPWQVAFAAGGRSLSTAQQNAMYDAVRKYLVAVGAVSP